MTDGWDSLIGRTAIDADGAKIGNVGQVYLDEKSGEPIWVTVSTGLFGTAENFAPLHGSSARGNRLVLAVSKRLVGEAPRVDEDGHLSDPEVAVLYQHYSAYLGRTEEDGEEGADAERYVARHAGLDLDGTETEARDDDASRAAEGAVIRSQERLPSAPRTCTAGRDCASSSLPRTPDGRAGQPREGASGARDGRRRQPRGSPIGR